MGRFSQKVNKQQVAIIFEVEKSSFIPRVGTFEESFQNTCSNENRF